MSTRSIVFAVSFVALTGGCGTDPGGDDHQEIIDNLVQAGVPADDIMVADGVVYVGRDGAVSLEASREMLQVDDSDAGQEQYRTSNLVSRSLATICVNGLTFTGKFGDALNRAINN